MKKTKEQQIFDKMAQLNKLRDELSKEKRRNDARRKILIGSAVIAAAEKDEKFAAELKMIIDVYVTRDSDRAFLSSQEAEKASSKTLAVQPVGELPGQ